MQSTPDLIHIGSLKSWTAPECTSINRVPMRATAYPFPTAQSARSVDREKTPWFQSLNGQWQFKAADRPENVVLTDIAVDSDRANWDSVEVPGNWTLQGYGAPQYTNVQMPFADEPPFVPEDNLTGIYAKEFSVPADWKGRRVVLHLGGAESVLYVYINGQAIGLSKDSRLPSEFDISQFVLFGQQNLVVVVVMKWSDASFIEDQDQWWMGGLHREVYIYSTASVHIADVFAVGSLENNYTDGRLKLKAQDRLSAPTRGRLASGGATVRSKRKNHLQKTASIDCSRRERFCVATPAGRVRRAGKKAASLVRRVATSLYRCGDTQKSGGQGYRVYRHATRVPIRRS
jgi:beta-galactosidase